MALNHIDNKLLRVDLQATKLEILEVSKKCGDTNLLIEKQHSLMFGPIK